MISVLLRKVFPVPTYHRAIKNIKMYSKKTGLPLEQVVNAIQSFANTNLAESWDNVGLLIEPSKLKNVTHIICTNDLTEDVMEESIDLGVDMIISYHPPIFVPLKSITTKSWKVS